MPAPVATSAASAPLDELDPTDTAEVASKRAGAELLAPEASKRQKGGARADGESKYADSLVPALADGAITMSAAPRARWATLPVLDVIQQRNKPVEPPKV